MAFNSLTLRPSWLAPLILGVRGVAVIVIGVCAYYWFGSPSPTAAADAAAPGLRAEVFVPLAGGRRLAFSIGPARTSDDTGARLDTAREANNVPHAAAAAPAARATPLTQAAPSKMCVLGDGVIQQASFNAGPNGTVSAYGLDDVAAINAAQRDEFASFTLPLLQRVHEQGALAGLQVEAAASAAPPRPLPNTLGGGDGASAGDYAMAAAHGAIDFLVVGHGDYAGELNTWYHSLNAGMRTQLVGPMSCSDMAGDEAVAPRGVVGLNRPASLMRHRFAEHVNYVSDGHSQLIDFAVSQTRPGPNYGSEVRLSQPGVVPVTLSVSAELPLAPTKVANRSGWNIENARLGTTRLVSVEVVVNGKVAAAQLLPADGAVRTMRMQVPISRSAWVAVRLPGAGHSHPVYVLVDNHPVRASRASVEWNIQALMRAYEAGSASWNAASAPLANAAYEYAFAVYNRILQETSEP